MDALDAPTVFRQGVPTLGVPVLSVDYRPGGGTAPHIVPPTRPGVVGREDPRWSLITARLLALESAVAILSLPWYTKFWRSLRGLLSRAAQRWHAPSSSSSFKKEP